MKHDSVEPPLPAAARLFPGDRLDLARRYADLLATDGVVRGLIGPREAPRLWERHLLNCALLAAALPRDATVADVGSGAGLPGIVLGITRPDLRITLVEPLLRRTTFLTEVVDGLGLDHVIVRRGRADALHGEATFDVVTARAVAPLERLLGWCMPLVAPTGALVAMKGSSVTEEIETARPVLDRLGCGEPVVSELRGNGEDGAGAEILTPTWLVRVPWADPARVSLRTSGQGGDASRSGPSGKGARPRRQERSGAKKRRRA